jgi:hypothetical protein
MFAWGHSRRLDHTPVTAAYPSRADVPRARAPQDPPVQADPAQVCPWSSAGIRPIDAGHLSQRGRIGGPLGSRGAQRDAVLGCPGPQGLLRTLLSGLSSSCSA